MSLANRTREHKGYMVRELHECNLILDTREIFLHGYIGELEEDPGTDYRSAMRFIKNVRLLNLCGSRPIIVHQYNVGGETESGMAIFDAIQHSSSPIIMVLYGVAASMGSIIPQAADTRIIMPNCLFMVHNGYTGVDTNLTVKQSKSWHIWEEYMTELVLNIYAERCKDGTFFTEKKSKIHDVRKYIEKQLNEKEDWFLNAHEATELGFVDGILGQDYNLEDLCK